MAISKTKFDAFSCTLPIMYKLSVLYPIQLNGSTFSRIPADIITRGTTPRRILSAMWLNGPPFLMAQNALEEEYLSCPLEEDDPEMGTADAKATTNRMGFGTERFTRFSSWSSLRRALATLILKAKKFKEKSNSGVPTYDASATEFQEAEILMIKNSIFLWN